MSNLFVTILAGGLGKRMKSEIPKVLHKAGGVPMLVRIIRQVKKLDPKLILIVVGKYKWIIEQTLQEFDALDGVKFAYQEIALGTGDAVKSTLQHLQYQNGYNLILNGDTPLLMAETLQMVCDNFTKDKSDLQITSISLENPTGCGRIIKDDDGVFEKIVEEKDCDDEQRKIKLVNVGIYVVSIPTLQKFIPKIDNDNAQKEYYLTDIVELYLADKYSNYPVGLVELPEKSAFEICNVNTKEHLEEINKILDQN